MVIFICTGTRNIPEVKEALETMQKQKNFNIQGCSNCLYLGRGYNFRFALEGFKVKRDLSLKGILQLK
jgi:glucosamine 6-phosphate synthetase-like amidotransferase/phosphosugar isomerase protein